MTSIDMDSKWHEWLLAASRHWCRLRLTSRIAILTERFEGVNIGGTGGSCDGGGGVGRWYLFEAITTDIDYDVT